MANCNSCGTELKIGYNWSEALERKHTYKCKDCRAAYQREYHKANREERLKVQRMRYLENREDVLEQQKYYSIQKKYGLSKDEYDELMHGASCGICGKLDDLCIDHDHNTGEIRGVLCRQCNQGIGLLGDSYEGLIKAMEYLHGK